MLREIVVDESEYAREPKIQKKVAITEISSDSDEDKPIIFGESEGTIRI